MIRYLQKLKAKRGFTIIELIVVVAIIAVLMAVVLPQLTSERSRINEANSAARDFYSAIQTTMSKYATFDGQLSNKYYEDSNLGIVRYYPQAGGNFPFDKQYTKANTDKEYPAPASLYIMVHAQNDVIKDVEAVTRAHANDKSDPGLYQLLKHDSNDKDICEEFRRLLIGEIDDRVSFNDGWYYARVDFTYKTVMGKPEDIGQQTVKVAYTAFTRKELPKAPGTYDASYVNSTLVFGSDNKLNTGEICGTCSAWDFCNECSTKWNGGSKCPNPKCTVTGEANKTKIGYKGTTLT